MVAKQRHIAALALFMSLMTSHGGWGQEKTIVPPNRSDFHLFLLVGQSNMAGRGKVEPQDLQPYSRVLMLDKHGEWTPAVDPLHFDKPKLIGVGLGKTFALDYAREHRNVTVGLIPCAAGGSPIAAWEPGGYHDQTKSHPYDEALARARPALKSGTLKGILWHQGESDSKPELSPIYETKLHALIDRLRNELNAPEVPFIVGQMGQFDERPWNDDRKQIDRVHHSLPDNIPNAAFVSSEGLSHKGDQVHFDSASYRELGHRYYSAYRALVGGPPPVALQYEIQRTAAHKGFDGKLCWVHARAGILPPLTLGNPTNVHHVVMTTQQLLLTGSDVFYALHETRSLDLSKSWSPLTRQASFARQDFEDGREVTVCDFTPKWHTGTNTLLGTGQTVWYAKNRVMHVRPRATAYAVYDPEGRTWSAWKRLVLPDEPRFKNAGAGSVQRFDLENGEILLPIYFKEPEKRQYSTTVCRCSFDGDTLKYREHGSELTVNVQRGLCEPSITRFGGRFFLTMRNDVQGYVGVSDDGLHYQPVRPWKFDDGTDLGNYNTQQHWITHSDALFLVYTRKGADNDHVFRHRAPLFMAQVDPEKLQVIRETERVLVPERGARLGNFGVVDVSADETWVTVTEWMQPLGVEEYGSDNSIFVARLLWNRPNRSLRE